MKSRSNAASESELEVLKALWHHGPGTVRQVNDWVQGQGSTWAYTTVLTLLHRLEAKQLVRSDKSGLAHVFHPAVTREGFIAQRLGSLADQVCDGAATPLVRALVQGSKLSSRDIAELRGMLDALDGPGSRADSGKPV